MYLRRYAYFCDLGSDLDQSLSRLEESKAERDALGGLEAARKLLKPKRMVAVTPRSAVLAAAASVRCMHDAVQDEGAREKLPVFFASASGLGVPSIYTLSLKDAPLEGTGLESALFSSDGPHVAETVRYAAPMLGGMIAQFSGIRGENRSLTGTAAGAIALGQARRFLECGRASDALVVCGESLLEWSVERLEGAARPGPSEIGCAFLVSSRRAGAIATIELECGSALATPPIDYFEAANAPASLCWALENVERGYPMFQETNHRGQQWVYGIGSVG